MKRGSYSMESMIMLAGFIVLFGVFVIFFGPQFMVWIKSAGESLSGLFGNIKIT